MILSNILTTIMLWLIAWVTPWPIILLAFSEILKSKSSSFFKWYIYVLLLWLIEFIIWFFLIFTSKLFQIPQIIFHFLSIIWVFLLIHLAFQIYKISKIDFDKENKKTSLKSVILLTFFNGALWSFWASVCLPFAINLWNIINFWEYLFLIIFEFSMIFSSAILLIIFGMFKKIFSNERIISKFYIFLSLCLWFIALKILYWEIVYFLLLKPSV